MSILRRLCPATHSHARPTARAAYLRFYSNDLDFFRLRDLNPVEEPKWQHKELYPRITKQDGAINYPTFKERYRTLSPGESKPEDEVVVRGTSSYSLEADLAYAVKEEFGRFGLPAESWHSSTCSRTVGVCSRTAIYYNACLNTPSSKISRSCRDSRAF